MKKFDLKNVAIASIFMIGIAFLIIAGAMIYGVCALYEFDSGLPGAFALVIIGVWVAHDSASMLNRWTLEYLSEIDLAKEDNK